MPVIQSEINLPFRVNVPPVRWGSFFLALLAAPIFPALVALPFLLLGILTTLMALFSIVAFIPITALIIGGIPFLLIGGPVLAWVMTQRSLDQVNLVGLSLSGLLASLGLLALGASIFHLFSPQDFQMWLGVLAFLGVFGLIFAPLWTGLFAGFYRRFTETGDARC